VPIFSKFAHVTAFELHCGKKPVTVKQYNSKAVTWANLENIGTVLLGDYIDKVKQTVHAPSMVDTIGYLFDANIPFVCPSILPGFTVPKYFAGDYLQRISAAHSGMKDAWPTLFIGPNGSKAGLHVDQSATHFWMALLEGRKEWIVVPPKEVPLLYPDIHLVSLS